MCKLFNNIWQVRQKNLTNYKKKNRKLKFSSNGFGKSRFVKSMFIKQFFDQHKYFQVYFGYKLGYNLATK